MTLIHITPQVSLLFMPPRTLSPLVFMSPDNSLCHSPTPPLSLALTFKELQEYPSSVRWCCFYEVHGAMAFLVQMCPDVSWSPCPPVPLISTQVREPASLRECLDGGLVYLHPVGPSLV